MSDNAATHDLSDQGVHPTHSTDDGSTTHHPDQHDHADTPLEPTAEDIHAGLSLEEALGQIPPDDDEDDLDHTAHFDPDLLTNLAALSHSFPEEEDDADNSQGPKDFEHVEGMDGVEELHVNDLGHAQHSESTEEAAVTAAAHADFDVPLLDAVDNVHSSQDAFGVAGEQDYSSLLMANEPQSAPFTREQVDEFVQNLQSVAAVAEATEPEPQTTDKQVSLDAVASPSVPAPLMATPPSTSSAPPAPPSAVVASPAPSSVHTPLPAQTSVIDTQSVSSPVTAPPTVSSDDDIEQIAPPVPRTALESAYSSSLLNLPLPPSRIGPIAGPSTLRNDLGRAEPSSTDADYRAPKGFYESGKLKRRRNRTVLSCTECHRRKQLCDRNIPCSRCVRRGIPSMCRMEVPTVTQRKRKRLGDDGPMNYELGLRVHALESLIRSGSNMGHEAASSAAMETIMQATRAANQGQPEAVQALQQLTGMGGSSGLTGLSHDAQNSLLLDVLQQLSAASLSRPLGNGDLTHPYPETRDTWTTVPVAAPDTAVHIETAYSEDDDSSKLNVALPGFRNDNDTPFLPPTVRYAERKLREESTLTQGPLPIQGYEPFLESATRLAYGEDSIAFKNKRIAAQQAISQTGALRLAATFVSRFPATPHRVVYIPTPTAEEDIAALRDGGLEVKPFRFLDMNSGLVDWEGMREDLAAAPAQSAILLYVSGSMPTGAELSPPQWRMLTTVLQERNLIPLVVMAFQGLSSGDIGRDAQPMRFMVHEGLPVVLVQTFDATMGLHADSPAVVSIPTQSDTDRDNVDSQLRAVARSMYHRPPLWGANIVHYVLSDAKLYSTWLGEIKAMSDRLRSVREKLYDTLSTKLSTPSPLPNPTSSPWQHIKRSAGLYCSLLLPANQAEWLTTKRHVHLLRDSCVSLGALNESKIETLARAVDWVVKEGIREAEEQQAQAIAMQLALDAAREDQARQEAEAAAAEAAAAAAAAQEEDQRLMEASILTAMEAQRLQEEDDLRREEENQFLDDAVRKAAERAEIQRRAELILASI